MSTSNPITIRYRWDRENFEHSFSHAYQWYYKHSARRYIGWFFIAMAQFGVVAALKKGAVGLLMLSTLLILYWYVGKKWLVKRRASTLFEHSPLKDRTVTLEVDKEGIRQGDAILPWEEVEGVVDTDNALILYHHGKAYYLPSSGFESIEERSRFKSLAKEKGKWYD